MNYYIDFDNAMYNTGKLLNRMYEAIANETLNTVNAEKVTEEYTNKKCDNSETYQNKEKFLKEYTNRKCDSSETYQNKEKFLKEYTNRKCDNSEIYQNKEKISEEYINQKLNNSKINQNKEEIVEECKSKFGKENITDIYELAKYFANKYNLNLNPIINGINAEILNSNDLVFNDVIPFLNRLKEKEHKLFILSYGGKNIQYQSLKIVGSGIANYFDGIYLSANLKYELDINYGDGIFIDDNPRDLLGIYSKDPKEVIRIRRPENKYSVKDLENSGIKEYKSFDDILI